MRGVGGFSAIYSKFNKISDEEHVYVRRGAALPAPLIELSWVIGYQNL